MLKIKEHMRLCDLLVLTTLRVTYSSQELFRSIFHVKICLKTAEYAEVWISCKGVNEWKHGFFLALVVYAYANEVEENAKMH